MVTGILMRHADNFSADGERCGGAGARRIQHMQRVGTRDEAEILFDLALRCDGLRAHAGTAGHQIVRLDLRNQPLQRTAEKLAAE